MIAIALLLIGALLASILSFIVVIQSLVVPKYFDQRRRSFGRLGVSLVALVALFIFAALRMPPPSPQDIQRRQQEEASNKAQKEESVRSEAKSLWINILRETEPCDESAVQVRRSTASKSMYVMYPFVKQAHESCQLTGDNITKLDSPPSSSDDVSDAFKRAIDTCSKSYDLKSAGFNKFEDVLGNLDTRPKNIEDVKTSMNEGNKAGVRCLLAFSEAGDKIGLSIGDLPKSSKE